MQGRTQGRLFRQKAMDKAFTAEELDKVMQVTRPTGWLALLVVGVIIVAALAWGFLGNLNVKVPAGGIIMDKSDSGQQAVLFLPFSNKESIKPGMKVLIAPAGLPPQEYGYLLGNVREVSQYPLTAQNLADILKNDALAAIFSQRGPEVMVAVELQSDENPGSYIWTTGRAAQVSSGTLLQANIIVDEKRPLELLLPN